MVLDFINFMCENDTSHEYEDPNNVIIAKANSHFLKRFGIEFHSARIFLH